MDTFALCVPRKLPMASSRVGSVPTMVLCTDPDFPAVCLSWTLPLEHFQKSFDSTPLGSQGVRAYYSASDSNQNMTPQFR